MTRFSRECESMNSKLAHDIVRALNVFSGPLWSLEMCGSFLSPVDVSPDRNWKPPGCRAASPASRVRLQQTKQKLLAQSPSPVSVFPWISSRWNFTRPTSKIPRTLLVPSCSSYRRGRSALSQRRLYFNSRTDLFARIVRYLVVKYLRFIRRTKNSASQRPACRRGRRCEMRRCQRRREVVASRVAALHTGSLRGDKFSLNCGDRES